MGLGKWSVWADLRSWVSEKFAQHPSINWTLPALILKGNILQIGEAETMLESSCLSSSWWVVCDVSPTSHNYPTRQEEPM